jgi:hypothetical protein
LLLRAVNDLDDLLTLIAHAPIVYHLRKLGDAGIDDWGVVVDDYEELILIDPPNRTLLLAAAGED